MRFILAIFLLMAFLIIWLFVFEYLSGFFVLVFLLHFIVVRNLCSGLVPFLSVLFSRYWLVISSYFIYFLITAALLLFREVIIIVVVKSWK